MEDSKVYRVETKGGVELGLYSLPEGPLGLWLVLLLEQN